jgi:type I restriction enzyme S subunit
MEHVEAQTMRLIGTVAASELKSSAVHFYDGDVLYGRLRPYLNKILVAKFEGLCSAEFIVFPKRGEISSRWLAYLLNSPEFVSFASHLNAGDRPRVDFDQIGEFELTVAPRDEQDRIVEEIEKQFSRLDAATAALKRVKSNLKRYRASVLKAACEGRLVPTEAELARKEGGEYEPAGKLLERILRERRGRWEADTLAKMVASGRPPKDDSWKQKYKEPTCPNTTGLPQLPDGWCWATVDQVGFVQLGRQRSPEHHAGPDMVPYLRVANVFEDRIDTRDVKEMNFTPAEQVTFGLHPGDILLNEGQSLELIGRPAMFRDEVPGCCFQNTLVRFRAAQSLDSFYALTVFLAYFHSGRLQRIAKWTTNIAHLGAKRFAGLEFPLPPIAEQRRIAEFCQGVTTHVEHLQAALGHQRERGSSLRKSILSSAFSGKLVPQDSTDEPASVLLDRIRTGRVASESGRSIRKRSVEQSYA